MKEIKNDIVKAYTEIKYLDKTQFLYRIPDKSLWEEILSYRKSKQKYVPLSDQKGNKFWFVLTEGISKLLKIIDDHASTTVIDCVDERIKNEVIHEFLVDESFSSSVIEGAFSTKKRTSEMITKKLNPQNLSEQMIYNNYNALKYILDNIDEPLSEKVLLEINKIVTEKTLEDEDVTEKYRTDIVYVTDAYSTEPIYTAPKHQIIQEMMDDLFAFISNADDIHPIIKGCIIHFYFVYVHPFFDGNGRTARAMSFMYLIQNNYGFFKFFSVSSMIKDTRRKYYDSIKQTEDYNNDLTYFISYMIEMYVQSINSVLDRFITVMGRKLINIYLDNHGLKLSRRQHKVLDSLLADDKSNFISIDEYRRRYKTSYETARSDLMQLTELGLTNKIKQGRKYVFSIVNTDEMAKLIQNHP